jgi:hypothetical protein
MKRLAVFGGAVVLTLWMAGPSSAAVIFQDDFNRADSAIVGNDWLEAGASVSISGNALQIRNNGSATQGDLSTVGLTDIVLSFDYRRSADVGNSDEALLVSWSLDGTTFSTLLSIAVPTTSATFTSVLLFALPAAAANIADLSIRFEFASAEGNDFLLIDNVVLEGTAVPLPAALPLYGTGLGLMGLFGWWRKRRAAASNPSMAT